MSTVTDPARAAREELSGFKGRLIGPDDAEYGEASPVYNAMIHKRPALVAQVRFVEWTGDGHLRHAAFLGLRNDKRPGAVRREPL